MSFSVRQSTSITGCVRRSVGRSVGLSVKHSFDDPHALFKIVVIWSADPNARLDFHESWLLCSFAVERRLYNSTFYSAPPLISKRELYDSMSPKRKILSKWAK